MSIFQSRFYRPLNIAKEICHAEEENYPTYYVVQLKILEPNFEEVKHNIIKMLKNNKAPKEDNIISELIKISTLELE